MNFNNRFFLGLLLALCLDSHADTETNTKPEVVLHTSKGPITVQLYPEQSPVTVKNFLSYAKSGFYDDTIFHRVIKRFMIQGGGFTTSLKEKVTQDPIVNESNNGLHNERWTIAMARTSDPDSATAQFFINTKMNSNLDAGRGKLGYTVFGIVTEGHYVVRAIEKSPVITIGAHQNLPAEPITINRVEIK